eukprot:gene19810-23559_t
MHPSRGALQSSLSQPIIFASGPPRSGMLWQSGLRIQAVG